MFSCFRKNIFGCFGFLMFRVLVKNIYDCFYVILMFSCFSKKIFLNVLGS